MSLSEESPEERGDPTTDAAAEVPQESERAEGVGGPRFCGRCGSPLAPEGTGCARCSRSTGEGPTPLASRPKAAHHPLLDILGLYSILLATMLPFAVSERVGDEERVDAGMLLGVLIADAVVVLLWAAARRSLMERLLLKRVGGAWIAFAGLISLGTFAFAFAFVEILKSALGAEEVTASEPFLEGGYGWGILILAVCVQPAVIEEIAFRGIILEALGSFLTRKEAIVVSSLMFTTIHLSAFGLPQLVLGVILAWLRLRTGSLLPCMALHFGHNLWVVLSEALLPV